MSVEPICERRRGGCAKRARGDLTESIVEGERQSRRPTPDAKRPTVLILLGALSPSCPYTIPFPFACACPFTRPTPRFSGDLRKSCADFLESSNAYGLLASGGPEGWRPRALRVRLEHSGGRHNCPGALRTDPQTI